jgi:hypothetical protein
MATCFVVPSLPTIHERTVWHRRLSRSPFVSVQILRAQVDGLESHLFHRRSAISSMIASTCSVLLPSLVWNQPCSALSTVPDSVSFPSGLLESRVLEDVLSPPTYGMEGPDIFYPSWFAGTWSVASTTTSVEAPCGEVLFGAKAMYAAAQADVGTTLNYESRFIEVGADPALNSVIADRTFNIQSIAIAAVGPNSVLDMTLVTPNKVSVILAPPGAPNLVKIDLLTLNRRQEEPDDTHFHCSEVVREILSPIGNRDAKTALKSPILKEVETTSLYQRTYDPKSKNETIKCRQRSASYLVPSQDNPTLFRMWELSQGKPVDVRFFDVIYTRKRE